MLLMGLAAASAWGGGATCGPPRATARMTSLFEKENPYVEQMVATARQISRRGYGILAADESLVTAGKRLETIGLDNTVENRRAFREVRTMR